MNIILGDSEQSENNNINPIKKEHSTKTNLFQGRLEPTIGEAKFPDWDITPPNQFINPRIKQQ